MGDQREKHYVGHWETIVVGRDQSAQATHGRGMSQEMGEKNDGNEQKTDP